MTVTEVIKCLQDKYGDDEVFVQAPNWGGKLRLNELTVDGCLMFTSEYTDTTKQKAEERRIRMEQKKEERRRKRRRRKTIPMIMLPDGTRVRKTVLFPKQKHRGKKATVALKGTPESQERKKALERMTLKDEFEFEVKSKKVKKYEEVADLFDNA